MSFQWDGKTFNQVPGDRGNKAMLARGGIDFNSNKMNLQLQNAGQEIQFHIDPAMLQQLQNAPGFVPVIINVQPLKNLQEFLNTASKSVI